MVEATAPNGDKVLIREWPRRPSGDDDLVDIWKHELRQLHRLGGYPGAPQYIARLIDADSDVKGFYIVLDAGQRRPLEILLERGRASVEWLRALNLPANRHRLWSNLQRVARGLEILHNEGLVHRNLDGWAILTSAGEDPDFQLTGFEWSLRLSSATAPAKRRRGPALPVVSFARDWEAFANLAARIFNITESRLNDLGLPDYEVHESASALEVRLLRDLLHPGQRRLDGELVSRRIEALLTQFEAQRSGDDGRYHLALRLSQDSGLSAAVREASELQIETEDTAGQLAWIQADIGEAVRLLAVQSDGRTLLFIRGRALVYRLKQFKGGEDPSWQFAFCENADPVATWSRAITGATDLPTQAVRLMPHGPAHGAWQRMQGKAPSWSRLINALETPEKLALSRETKLHRALTLLHALDLAFSAAMAFPVRVVRSGAADEPVTLEYIPSDEAKELSEALGLENPLTRLQDALDSERVDGEGWVLTESARLGQAQAGDTELAYDQPGPGEERNRFQFRQTSPGPILLDQGFLVPAAARGDFVQFRRRSKALRALKDHAELLQVLADPRRRLIASHDDVEEDSEFQELDAAKQAALKELTGVLPIYLLQGPPGVGKTYLVRDVVRRQFEQDSTPRLLITAQGNHAIDHLLDELSMTWANSSTPPLAVRCRAKDDQTSVGDYDLSKMTGALAAKLATTPLAATASGSLATRLQTLSGNSGDAAWAAGERRSLESLLMRAANLVFATTNSADLERLVEERGQFDWTIVEEAGKATGVELVAPMMLSHRRMMIGDHKQLPPFGAAEMDKLLADVQGVRRSVKALPKSVHPAVRTLLDDDLLEFADDDAQDLENLCAEARRALFLFETAIETELERKQNRPGGRSIASTLSVQHRMHPAICDLVSRSFYDGKLVTSQSRKEQATANEKAIGSKDQARLPNTPVVFVDMPYERSATHKGRIERYPRFTNEEEVREITALISLLQVSGSCAKPPSLVILAPYLRQVRRLKEAVLADGPARTALEAFRPVARGGEWCSTVDAFQGNEADVVVISLVRNNRKARIRAALGFMADRRRFNVALSRARQKLLFVGSLEFLRTIARPMGLESDPEADFLRSFLSVADEQFAAGSAARITPAPKEKT